MIVATLKAIGRAYLNSLLWFGAGAVAASIQAFLVLTAIYHGGVCR
jgi:hypothetical protein